MHCKRCLFLVNDFRDGKDIDHLLLLPEDYKCNGYHAPTRSVEGVVCWCTWCKLARMNGCQWRAFQFSRKARSRAKLKKQGGDRVGWVCPDCYKGIPANVQKHSCIKPRGDHGLDHPTPGAMAQNLLESLPQTVAATFVYSYLQQQQQQQQGESSTDTAGPCLLYTSPRPRDS